MGFSLNSCFLFWINGRFMFPGVHYLGQCRGGGGIRGYPPPLGVVVIVCVFVYDGVYVYL